MEDRYHLNPETGRPNKCRASKRPCPFGGPEAHYPTKLEAQRAYEQQMAGEGTGALTGVTRRSPRPERQLEEVYRRLLEAMEELSPEEFSAVAAVLSSEGRHEVPVPGGGSVTVLSANHPRVLQLLAEADPATVYRGRLGEAATPEWREKMAEATKRVEELLATSPAHYWHPQEGWTFKTPLPEGVRYLASGVHRMAFLDERTGLVYKLPNGSLAREDVDRLVRQEQESFAQLDHSLLSDSSPVRLAKTVFFTAESGIPVTVQEYIDPQEFYHGHSLEASYDLQVLKLSPEGETLLSDFTEDNVLTHRLSKQTVLIDCLNADEALWYEASNVFEYSSPSRYLEEEAFAAHHREAVRVYHNQQRGFLVFP